MANNKKLNEVNKKTRFSKTNQPTEEAKSNGQIEKAKNRNLLYSARTLFDNADILPDLVNNLKKEVSEGNNKNTIEFLKIIKEPETQNINLNGGVEVQKVFIDAETKQKTKQHIQDFIDGK